MNEDELFADYLHRILKELKEDKASINRCDGDNKIISKELDCQISLLERNLPNIKSEMDLFDLNEKDFLDVLQLVEDYLSVYIINNGDEKLKTAQEDEYNELCAILEWFYTDDDEDSEEEEEVEE